MQFLLACDNSPSQQYHDNKPNPSIVDSTHAKEIRPSATTDSSQSPEQKNDGGRK